MRQRQNLGPRGPVEDLTPVRDGLAQGRLGQRADVPRQGVRAHGKKEFNVRQRPKKGVAPSRSAFFSRRQVAAVRVLSRIAKSHRNNGDPALVVESRGVDAHPGAQPVARCVGEGRAGGVDARSGSLACDANPGRRGRPEDRPRLVRQDGASGGRVTADAAGANCARNRVQRRFRWDRRRASAMNCGQEQSSGSGFSRKLSIPGQFGQPGTRSTNRTARRARQIHPAVASRTPSTASGRSGVALSGTPSATIANGWRPPREPARRSIMNSASPSRAPGSAPATPCRFLS
jgi:hypothetical protein